MSPNLAAGSISLKHLKHLVMASNVFDSKRSRAGKQLPALETLCIEGADVDVVNVTGCRHL